MLSYQYRSKGPFKQRAKAMPPPPAEPLASRILLGPALRTQSDRRLVKLVREGYEAAFEEIVRRYRKPLDRFAAAIVGGRSEDVTQDAFSKALLALRGSKAEIELRPWLYRIVRNTALNDLRDRPAAAEQLGEAISGGLSAAVEAERREEMAELIERLRALPEPQRAAIVMRELEGLSHEEIAAALGVSGGAARQAIYRARAALRDGLGLLVPLPLLRLLFDHGAEAAAAGAGGAAAAAGAASTGGGGAILGGLGAGGAVKAGVATALIAGSVGAGVAVERNRDGGDDPGPAAAVAAPEPGQAGGSEPGPSPSAGPGGGSSSGTGESRGGDRGSGDGDRDDDRSGREDDSSGEGSSGGDDREDRSEGRDSGEEDDRASSGGSGSGDSGPGGEPTVAASPAPVEAASEPDDDDDDDVDDHSGSSEDDSDSGSEDDD